MAWAALMVAAVMASAGVILRQTQAKAMTYCIDSVGDDPGLQSVASATGTPASIMSRAGANSSPIKNKVVAGKSTATTPASAMRRMPSADACTRWSADTAPTSAASSAPPKGTISSAWIFGRHAGRQARLQHPARLFHGEDALLAKDVAKLGAAGLRHDRDHLVDDQRHETVGIVPELRRNRVRRP